jgi:hypothetical protein
VMGARAVEDGVVVGVAMTSLEANDVDPVASPAPASGANVVFVSMHGSVGMHAVDAESEVVEVGVVVERKTVLVLVVVAVTTTSSTDVADVVVAFPP